MILKYSIIIRILRLETQEKFCIKKCTPEFFQKYFKLFYLTYFCAICTFKIFLKIYLVFIELSIFKILFGFIDKKKKYYTNSNNNNRSLVILKSKTVILKLLISQMECI